MGGAILLTRKFSASNFWRLIEKYRITNSMVVPTVLAILLKIGKEVKEKYDTSSLLGIVSAAAPLPIELQKEFESTFNIAIIPGGLGMTEVSSACFSFPDDKRIPGSVGMPINGVEALIVDQNNPDPNHPFEPNTVGEIIIKGPNVMKGYFKNPEGNAAVFLDGGWLRSGDLGYFNEDGYLFMGGRAKDMIIRGGENIYPIEIEDVLYKFPGISEAVVIGKPDKIYGELPKAFVTMKSGFNPNGEEILEFCRTKLADFKVPVEIEFRDSLPKSNLGKPDKKTLQDEEKKKYRLSD
jgi:long-chain acyl-CoA synthetase